MIREKLQKIQVKRLVILNLPYFFIFYVADKGSWLYRHCLGESMVQRLGVMLVNFRLAFLSWLPSVALQDLAVSYVLNHCGNGWNYGRLTAEGLRGVCTYVSPGEAKPGDLIFFQGTYNTSGASHVGIYVGNNMMIHCGDPIHYSNISTSYWQQHFMCFGRLP